MSGPFAAAALDMAARGLAVIPLGGEDGKVPQVAWANWRRPPGKNFLLKLLENRGGANVGIICGLSGLTVVDIDDAALANAMLERFGPTPLEIETPSGGRHFYYRSAGEGCASLRDSEGLPVDVKGRGGVVAAPPSLRPSGPHSGKCYRTVQGSWDDLPRLPTIKSGSLPASRPKPVPGGAGAVTEGARSNTLLKLLLRELKGCDSLDVLLDVARGINDSFVPPLPDQQIKHIAASAWGYESRGENWVGEESFVKVRRSEFELLCRDPDALALRIYLRFCHEGIRGDFAVSPRGMRNSEILPGWGIHRIRGARDVLIREGFLNSTHEGGAKPRDASRFRLAAPTICMGQIFGPNTNKQPLPSDIPPRYFADRPKNRPDDTLIDLVTLAGGEPAPRQAPAEIFGPQIKAARQARRMTQEMLAARVGVTRAALANIERAIYPASLDLQRRLNEILQVRAA